MNRVLHTSLRPRVGLAARRAPRTLCSHARWCSSGSSGSSGSSSSSSRGGSASGGKNSIDDEIAQDLEAEKERIARELVYGKGGQPPPWPWKQVIFTALVLGSYVAYVKLVEEPLDRQFEVASVPHGPMPPGASRRLPDGRLLMEDGSIKPAPP
jgi:hypothetical protein